MARYHYVILSRSVPGGEDEFRRWYAEQHLADVARHPAVIHARLFAPTLQKVYDIDAPIYTLMTMYELETDDPAGTIEAIRAQSGSPEMPSTDALDKSGMIQIIAEQIAAIDPA